MNSKYGFSVGQYVFARVNLFDEDENLVKAGEVLRIVAIVPKVRMTNPWNIKNKPEYHDNKEYFVNLVRADQQEDYSKRIRCNFVCISECKPLYLNNLEKIS